MVLLHLMPRIYTHTHPYRIYTAPSSFLFPHPASVSPSFSTHTSCKYAAGGHRVRAICSSTDTKFSFWQALLHCLPPVSHGLPPPFPSIFPVSLNHPAVRTLINDSLCPPIFVISLLIAILLLLISLSGHLSSWVLCIFTTARAVNPVFLRDKTTALGVTLWTCCHPPPTLPFLSLSPLQPE